MRTYRLKQMALAMGLFGVIAAPLAETDAASIELGTAKDFAILGASAVTNTGPTTLEGNLGVSPNSANDSITGFFGTTMNDGPGEVLPGSTIHQNDAVAIQAQLDARAAYVEIAAMGYDQDLSGQDLGGMTLTPGVYRFSSSAQLTGDLILDGDGPFIFQIGSTLTTAPGARVMQTPGSICFCDVFWQVGSSATIDTTTLFAGTILADQSVSFNDGAMLAGRAIALEAAVTMINNRVNIDTNAFKEQVPSYVVPSPTAVGSGLLMLGGLLAGRVVILRRRAAETA